MFRNAQKIICLATTNPSVYQMVPISEKATLIAALLTMNLELMWRHRKNFSLICLKQSMFLAQIYQSPKFYIYLLSVKRMLREGQIRALMIIYFKTLVLLLTLAENLNQPSAAILFLPMIRHKIERPTKDI